MSAPHRYLAWIDLETTGSDERRDPILEVALIVTQAAYPFGPLVEAAWVVAPPQRGWSAPAEVVAMHQASGLWADCFGPGCDSWPLRRVEESCTELLAQIGKPHDFALAGSGVAHFDRRFIAAQMPKLDRWLRYYSVDVGSVRRLIEASGVDVPLPELAKTHRALDDIRVHVEEARLYAQLIRAGASQETPDA